MVGGECLSGINRHSEFVPEGKSTKWVGVDTESRPAFARQHRSDSMEECVRTSTYKAD